MLKLRLKFDDAICAGTAFEVISQPIYVDYYRLSDISVDGDILSLVVEDDDEGGLFLRGVERLMYLDMIPCPAVASADGWEWDIPIDCGLREAVRRQADLAVASLHRNVGLFAEDILMGTG